MPRIPREAREGLMRAWLEILRERHPQVTWVAVPETAPPEDVTAANESATLNVDERLVA
jgi:hypothetical protein